MITFVFLSGENRIQIMDIELKKPTLSEWLSQVEQDLKCKKPIEELDYVVDDWVFSNFISAESAPKPHPIIRKPSQSGALCVGENSDQKNKNALNALECGVEAIGFSIENSDTSEVLFRNIFLDMIEVLCYSENSQSIDKFNAIVSQGYEGKPIKIHWIDKSKSDNYLFLDHNLMITDRLQLFKNAVTNRKEKGAFYLDIELKKAFIPQIAELRALRRIWEKAGQRDNLIVTTHISEGFIKNAEIHPLIICNYLMMSARLGMADFVMSLPYNQDLEIARLSLNIQHILVEESRFNEVSDPTAGAYIIEEMTEAFARF